MNVLMDIKSNVYHEVCWNQHEYKLPHLCTVCSIRCSAVKIDSQLYSTGHYKVTTLLIYIQQNGSGIRPVRVNSSLQSVHKSSKQEKMIYAF